MGSVGHLCTVLCDNNWYILLYWHYLTGTVAWDFFFIDHLHLVPCYRWLYDIYFYFCFHIETYLCILRFLKCSRGVSWHSLHRLRVLEKTGQWNIIDSWLEPLMGQYFERLKVAEPFDIKHNQKDFVILLEHGQRRFPRSFIRWAKPSYMDF
jgi:hypothetical protein